MITKKQLADEVIHILEGGNHNRNDSRYNRPYVYKYLDQALSFMIVKNFFQGRNMGEYNLPEEFITDSYKELKQNTKRDLVYIYLPNRLVSLPNDRGLVSISWKQGEGDFKIVRVKNESHGAWNLLESATLINKVGYWLEGTKIYFKNIDENLVGKEVLVKHLLSLDHFDEDEELPIPGDYEAEMIQQVVNTLLMKDQQRQDLTTDNVDA